MSDFEPAPFKETFCDLEPPEDRAYTLEYVLLKDIFLPNGFLEREVVKGDILDLGWGRGSLGKALSNIGKNISLVGVDIIKYEGEDFRKIYSEIRQNDAAKEVTQIKESGKKFDLVISFGLPPKAIEDLIDNRDLKDIVKPEGSVLLIFDAIIEDRFQKMARKAGFELRNGNYPSDHDILYWRNSSRLQD
jgi:2-polyprenyl-3-methyl-5-hydroxy-6-metoxy-1,4-benzoquinol methylase